MTTTSPVRIRPSTTALVLALLAVVMASTGVAAHPGDHLDDHDVGGLGVELLTPGPWDTDFLSAVQWAGTPAVDDETAELVYVGTGCSPANYVGVDVAGKIALVDEAARTTNPADPCPAATFFQKVQSAQQAGAIGFVQVAAVERRPNATAVAADIPALEVNPTDAAKAVVAAVRGEEEVIARLTDRTERLASLGATPCVGGTAGPFPCDGIDLLSFVSHEEFDSAGISDLWGWTDEDEGGEYVIIGKTNGVAFFRVTDPTAPEYLGELPNPGLTQEVWHDIKVFKDHAFIVSESDGHGMTVFDLRRLRDVGHDERTAPWDADTTYPLTSGSHNIEINTATGYAYIVGGNAGSVVPDHCLSGLHMVDINEPQNPTFAGCYVLEGGPGTAARTVGSPATDVSPMAYVHDAQCVIYEGPDAEHRGREICLNAAENKVVIVDVTDKLAPVTLGVTDYDLVAYTHQGWLSEDQGFWFVNDELDELTHDEVVNTRTVVLDVRDLDNPKPHTYYSHPTTQAITHNNYVVGDLLYQSNYAAGLRVADISGVADAAVEEVAFFDTFPTDDATSFNGTWSNYPFFESGTIAVSGRAEGLFLLQLADPAEEEVRDVELVCTDCPVGIRAGEQGTATLEVHNTGTADDTYDLTITGLPDGWTATAEPAQISVAAGQVGVVEVPVEVPRQARARSYTLTVTATSIADPDVTASEAVEVDVRKGRPDQPGGR